MQFKSKRWIKTIVAAVAALCLAGSGQTVANVVSASSADEKSLVKLDEKLGVKPGAILEELSAHEQDDYYLGTPYVSSPFTAENLMRPNGAYDGNGGMNCTGFVAYVMEKCGADLSGIASRGYSGGKVNASNWYHWMQENAVEYYHYDTVEELLASKKAQKGDVIYFNPIDWSEPDADCHIGFFWGDYGQDNKFWHSATKPERGNQISVLESKSPSTVYLFKITHTGTVEIRKKSSDPQVTANNRCYSLEAAEFTLYRKGADEAVAVITTDENGYGKAEGIEEGIYDIRETRAPKGYIADENPGSIEVKTGSTVVYECENMPQKSSVDLLIQKYDLETGESEPQGKASLEGAEFTVKYFDVISEKDPAKEGEQPVRTWVFKTDGEGKVQYSDKYYVSGDELYQENGSYFLPVGTITIQETKSPEGYLALDEIVVKCIDDGSEETEEILTYQTVKIPEKVVRGNLELIKVGEGSLEPLEGIPFKITSKTTGESHVIVTDENGYASTSEAGIWFGGSKSDDGRGTLIYDTYLIEELECENNSDRILIPVFEVEISKDNCTVDLGTLANTSRPVPVIKTMAREENTDGHQAFARENTVIIDEVSFENLVPTREYTVEGILMDAGTGEPLKVDNACIVAEKTFTAKEETGSLELEFMFDATGLEGKTIVVFENLYCYGKKVAAHEDLEDKNQTIEFPDMKISTSAKDKDSQTGTGEGREETVIIDTVTYENLIPGFEYIIRGTLMDAETGEPLVQNGEEITCEHTFTPQQADGKVELEFYLDASKMNGKSVVVYEKMYHDELLVAYHEDLKDKGQTVSFEKKIPVIPKIPTKEIPSVQTGDSANLIVLIFSLFLSCVVILKCVKIAHRK